MEVSNIELFNYILKDIKDASPFGYEETGYSLHWFGLTDSYYWLDINNHELFRYSEEFTQKVNLNSAYPYVDYQLSRLIEDFFEILPQVCENIPNSLFDRVSRPSGLAQIYSELDNWYEKIWDQENLETLDDVYFPARQWIYDRMLDTGYLCSAPKIYFFRNNDKLLIKWDFDFNDDDGTKVWQESNGEFTLRYEDFVIQIENFVYRFCRSMDVQVFKACNDWPLKNVRIDLLHLVEEHKSRKAYLIDCISKIKNGQLHGNTDWGNVESALLNISTK